MPLKRVSPDTRTAIPPTLLLVVHEPLVSAAPAERTRAGVRCKPLLGDPRSDSLISMTIKARVHDGRLVVDEPTDLPEGTEVLLLPLDPGDWLDETDRAALHEALQASNVDVAAGRVVDAEHLLRELRSR